MTVLWTRSLKLSENTAPIGLIRGLIICRGCAIRKAFDVSGDWEFQSSRYSDPVLHIGNNGTPLLSFDTSCCNIGVLPVLAGIVQPFF